PFEALAANGAIVAGANAEALHPVLQGAKAAVFGAVDYISLAGQSRGESIEVIFPTAGTVIAPRPVVTCECSQCQAEAKQFVEHILADAGQAAAAEASLMPARSDVPATRPLIGDLDILPIDAATVYAQRADTLKAFGTICGR